MIEMPRVKIEKIDLEGKGIGYVNGKIVFVPNALLGEIYDVLIVKEKKNYQIGKIQKIVSSHSNRLKPFCPYFFSCGGCDFAHLAYEDTISLKKNMLEELMRLNHLYVKEIPIISSKEPFFYRNKVSLKVLDGKLGFYEGRSHSFVEIQECKIAKQAINEILRDFEFFSFWNGELILRVNQNNEILMQLITKEKVNISDILFEKHKIVGIFLNDKCIYGVPYFFERKNGVLYQVSMNSFFQVNDFISESLFWTIRELSKNAKHVLDLYCGVGSLGLQLAKQGSIVTGIELVPAAVLNAVKNAKLNHFRNCFFHCGKVEQLILKIPLEFDTILVDPPRSGLDAVTRKTILDILPNSLIYVSCNPYTLIRDLKEFYDFYDIKTVKGFDMFPFTRHIETLCLLIKK